jgi:segregation and condensation protein B
MTDQHDDRRDEAPAADEAAGAMDAARADVEKGTDAAGTLVAETGGAEAGRVPEGPGFESAATDVEAEPVAEDGAAEEAAPDDGQAGSGAATAGRVSDGLKAIIEALVYASPDPLTPKTLFKVLESEPREDVQASLEALRLDYADGRGGLQLVEVAGGYQIVTRPELSEWVRRLFHERKTQKLSVAALETLAVIAYKQPITAPEITEIRGVNAAGVVATLLERRLIKIAGRKPVVGRPFLYATTREFLIRFGLRDLGDLPRMEDMADVLGFEPPSGLAGAGPSEALLPLDGDGDPDKSLDVDEG